MAHLCPFIDGLPIKNGDFPWLCLNNQRVYACKPHFQTHPHVVSLENEEVQRLFSDLTGKFPGHKHPNKRHPKSGARSTRIRLGVDILYQEGQMSIPQDTRRKFR